MTCLEQWFEEVWNKGDIDAIDQMTTSDAQMHGLEHPDGTPVEGKQGFKAFHKQLQASFSNIHVEVEQILTEGDMMMVRCVISGVHSGDGLGIPATGKKVEFTGMCLARLEGRKIAEAWNNFDLRSMYRQVQ